MTGKKNKLDKSDKQDKKEKSGKKKTGKDNKSRKHEKKEKDKKSRKHEKKAKTVSGSEHAKKHKTVKEEVAKETGATASMATVNVAHQDARAMSRAPEPSLTDMGKADAEPPQDTTTALKRHLPARLILAGILIALTGVWWGYQHWSTEPAVKKALPYKTGIAPMAEHKSQPGTATREQRSIRPPLPVPEKKMIRSPDMAHTENTDRSPATTPPVRHTYRPEHATETENDSKTATAPQQASRPVVRQPQSRHRPLPYGPYQQYPGRGWPSWQGNYPQQPYYRQHGYFGSE